MKKYIFFISILSILLFSCNTKKVIKGQIPHFDYTSTNVYAVIDSVAVDYMISKATYEHKRITNKDANCFRFSTDGETGYKIRSSSIFDFFFELPGMFGFAYYKEHILIISKLGTPTKLFKPTNEICYISSVFGMEDISYCKFDSTYQFISSENGIAIVK